MLIRTRRWLPAFVMIASALSVSVHEGSAAEPPDPKTPKGVLYAFGDAIGKTDIPAAKALTPGTADDLRMIDGFAAVGAAQRKLHAVAEKKFGKDDITTIGTGSSVAADRFKDSEQWDEKVDGDTATLTHKPEPAAAPPGRRGGPSGVPSNPPVQLKRVAGVWKLDLATMVPAGKREIYIGTLNTLAKVGNDLCDEISADKYPDAATAKAAYRDKMVTGLRAQVTAGGGGKPAVKP